LSMEMGGEGGLSGNEKQVGRRGWEILFMSRAGVLCNGKVACAKRKIRNFAGGREDGKGACQEAW